MKKSLVNVVHYLPSYTGSLQCNFRTQKKKNYINFELVASKFTTGQVWFHIYTKSLKLEVSTVNWASWSWPVSSSFVYLQPPESK